MLSRSVNPTVAQFIHRGTKNITIISQRNYKVSVIGAAGGIGQPLSLLLKKNPLVTDLALYDIVPKTPGVAVDVSHVNTAGKVGGYVGEEQLEVALQDADVVVVPAGVARKPGMTRDDLFTVNATLIRDLACNFGRVCPGAMLAIVTNPVNSLVPLAAEVLDKMGVFDKDRIFGVTTLDLVRSSTFVGEICGVDPRTVSVPVVGGHAGITIIPVLSQSDPPLKLKDDAKVKELVAKIQEAGTEVVKAKAGGGSATLSTAYATARFVNSLLRGMEGESDIVECAYVRSEVTDAKFFATPLVLGKCGVDRNLGLGCLNSYEESLIEPAVAELNKNIEQGINFAKNVERSDVTVD